MNKINPIFEALSGVDERHVPVNEKKRPGKKMKIALIAVVSAAALALIVGASSRANSTFLFGYNDSYDRGFTLELYSHEITVPEECLPEPGKDYFIGRVVMPASELVKKFGLPMLINDNFSDIEAKTDKEKPWVNYGPDSPYCTAACFEYYLRDNITDRKVHFYTIYHSNVDTLKHTYSTHLTEGTSYEIVKLNNGSLCLVTCYGAEFAYYGASFSLTLPDEKPEGYEEWTQDKQESWLSEQPIPDMDAVKQVLTDLGLL